MLSDLPTRRTDRSAVCTFKQVCELVSRQRVRANRDTHSGCCGGAESVQRDTLGTPWCAHGGSDAPSCLHRVSMETPW